MEASVDQYFPNISNPTISHCPSTQRYNYTSLSGPNPTPITPSTSLGAKIAEAVEEEKQRMGKEEIESLRNSVLLTTRPKNPWFDQTAPAPKAVGGGGGEGEPVAVPAPPKPKAPNHAYQYSRHSYVPNECIRPTTTSKKKPSQPPIKADFPAPRNEEPTFLTADLRMLEQLEAESMVRRARIGGGSGNASPPIMNAWPDLSLSPASSNYSSSTASATQSDSSPYSRRHSSSAYPKEKCAQCKGEINEAVLHAMGSAYHPQCFRCCTCYSCLDGKPFVVDNHGGIYCMEDYERSFVPACAKCHKSIRSSNELGQLVRIVLKDREYHVECYTCEGCNLQLGNEAHNRCYPIREHLLCRTCHAHWKRYGAVDQPITDL